MLNLVEIKDRTAVTTSLAIADGTQNPHPTVIKLVRKYQDDLSEFGTFGFEIQKSGGRPTEYAVLNEPQATLLMTYMRNTDVVRQFKKRLVKAFYEMAEQIRDGSGQRKQIDMNYHGLRSGPEIRLTLDLARLARQADKHLDGKASLRLLHHLTELPVDDLIKEIEVKALEKNSNHLATAELLACYLFALLKAEPSINIAHKTDLEGRPALVCTTATLLEAFHQLAEANHLPTLDYTEVRLGQTLARVADELQEHGWRREMERINRGQRFYRYTCLDMGKA